MKILITGATGFVGRSVTKSACLAGHDVTALVRNFSDALPEQVSQIAVGDFVIIADVLTNAVIASKAEKSQDASIEPALSTAERGGMTTGWYDERLVSAMQNVEVVIHTAARAHVMKEKHSDPAEIYRQINVAFTQQLAEAAVEAGVKRFVFLSSIKVNGEATYKQPFTESDFPDPKDDYAKSKWQAEQVLTEICQRSGMEIVILRSPMIYGPGVKGNFANLLTLVNKCLPLPFGNINNQRSLLALDNLVSAILMAAEYPAAANQTFLVADDESVSTTELIRNIATAQGKKARLIPISVSLMISIAKVLGKQSVADRLFGSLQIDTTKIQRQLGWRPVVTMQQQLEKM